MKEITVPQIPVEEQEEPQIHHEKGDRAYMTEVAFMIERVRIPAQIRISHLAKTGRKSPDTEQVLAKAQAMEAFIDATLASYITSHPTWAWASRIKGVGKENYPKVVGLIEKFGRYYDVGDPMIPPFVKREPEAYQILVEGKVVDKVGIMVLGIERLATVSKLWKYAGLDVQDGYAPRPVRGEKLPYNDQLRMACFRLGTGLLRLKQPGIWATGGDPEEGYSRGYQGHRLVVENQLATKGLAIVPTPKGRICPVCNIEVSRKATFYCPQCGRKLTLKAEDPGIIHLGHVHRRVTRLMIKDFLACAWLVWRRELGLPAPEPYGVAILHHKPIDPWKMVDR